MPPYTTRRRLPSTARQHAGSWRPGIPMSRPGQRGVDAPCLGPIPPRMKRISSGRSSSLQRRLLMAKRKLKRNGRSGGESRHVRLYHWLLTSPAWKSLGPVSRALYVELSSLYAGTNNGDLFLSVRDAGRRMNVDKNTAGRAFRELEDRGFIRPRQKGSFDWKARHATSWVLTEHPVGDALATKEFMKWRPTENDSSVPVEGLTVPHKGQMKGRATEKGQICPSTRTDPSDLARPRSLHRDTYSLPSGVPTEGAALVVSEEGVSP